MDAAPEKSAPRAPSRERHEKDEEWKHPRDRYFVLILNLLLVFACLSFIVHQHYRTDLPAIHPAGGTIVEKGEDEETEEFVEEVVANDGPAGEMEEPEDEPPHSTRDESQPRGGRAQELAGEKIARQFDEEEPPEINFTKVLE